MLLSKFPRGLSWGLVLFNIYINNMKDGIKGLVSTSAHNTKLDELALTLKVWIRIQNDTEITWSSDGAELQEQR